MNNNLAELLPSYYDGIRETNELMSAESSLLDELDAQMRAVMDNQFIMTCDIPTLEFWEQVLNILHDPATETTRFRRERIINRISSRPPFTLLWLRRRLDMLVGAGNYEIRFDYDRQRLELESAVDNYMYFREMIITVTRVLPANVIFTLVPYIRDSIYFYAVAHVQHYALMRAGTSRVGVTKFHEYLNEERVVLN